MCIGRKSGKGCYVYGEGKGKKPNEEAEKLLEKYRIPVNGRFVFSDREGGILMLYLYNLYKHRMLLKGVSALIYS